jgi:hypothetical protein
MGRVLPNTRIDCAVPRTVDSTARGALRYCGSLIMMLADGAGATYGRLAHEVHENVRAGRTIRNQTNRSAEQSSKRSLQRLAPQTLIHGNDMSRAIHQHRSRQPGNPERFHRWRFKSAAAPRM